MNKFIEIWKPVKNYEGFYEVSNKGNVRSINRIIIYKNGRVRKQKGIILKPILGINTGYYKVCLSINRKTKNREIHQLVAESFLNHKSDGFNNVVNHKDFNRKNNCVNNLEIITTRDNTNLIHIKSSSQFVGVSWDKKANKWRSAIKHNGKQINLGRFEKEIDAANAYINYKSDHNL